MSSYKMKFHSEKESITSSIFNRNGCEHLQDDTDLCKPNF
jgi:hypothetical protein